MSEDYHYIIIGAGSSGCVLANLLSADSKNRVLLIEAGPKDNHPLIDIPIGFAPLMTDKKHNWLYQTEPEVTMNNRKMKQLKGKVLGGSSSINGMVYIRGCQQDYDNWAAAGNKGWSYDDVLPYFKRSEKNSRGESDYHGNQGPLKIEESSNHYELAQKFIQAGLDTGLPFNPDFNAGDQEGMGFYQVNIKSGKRQSAAKNYLDPIKKRNNLDIICLAHVSKILFKDKTAIGVEVIIKDQLKTFYASKEIICCAGTIASPQLLETSGIGNKQRLESIGIKSIQHLPGVGENLQDHLTINILYMLKDITTFYEEMRPLSLIKNLFKYYIKGTGLLAHPAAEAGGFFKALSESERCDAQIHFAPAAGEEQANGALKTVPGTTGTVCFLQPESRGSTHITSMNIQQSPAIQANYLSTPHDKKVMIEAFKRLRAIFNAPTLAPYRVNEIAPGSDVQSDDEILEYIKTHAETLYHCVGTCKMGHDRMSVVDDRLRVHGLHNLRVVDASIMPTIISGNTHAACVMIAEKAADMIVEDHI